MCQKTVCDESFDYIFHHHGNSRTMVNEVKSNRPCENPFLQREINFVEMIFHMPNSISFNAIFGTSSNVLFIETNDGSFKIYLMLSVMFCFR